MMHGQKNIKKKILTYCRKKIRVSPHLVCGLHRNCGSWDSSVSKGAGRSGNRISAEAKPFASVQT